MGKVMFHYPPEHVQRHLDIQEIVTTVMMLKILYIHEQRKFVMDK